jgi:phosphopantothenoylcysteine synthetase/decarboxylase
MDDENSLESILPKEVLDKIASAVQGRTVQLSGAAIGKATNTGTLTVGAAATVGAMAEVIRALPSPAESKKLWESPLGQTIIQILAGMIFLLIQEQYSNIREQRSDESTKELVKKISELLQTHSEKAPPPPSNGGD